MSEEKSSTVISIMDSSDDEDIDEDLQNARDSIHLSDVISFLQSRISRLNVQQGNDDIKQKELADQTIDKFVARMEKSSAMRKCLPKEQQDMIEKINTLLYMETVALYEKKQYKQCAIGLNAFMDGMDEVIEL